MTSVWHRWLPAAVAAPVVIVAGVLVAPLAAGAAPSLPSKSPQQVLELALKSTVETFSGTVKQSSDLGLPDLPSTGPSADSDAASTLELLTGSHTARVYADGASKQRVQVLDSLAERDVVRNGNDVWLYDSNKNEATHTTLPNHSGDSGASTPSDVQTPEQVAQQILTDLDPSTTLSTDKNVSIAGRSAYDLVLTPKAKDTLIGSVAIAVDSETGLPLRVDVQAKGQNDPAFEVAFSSVSFVTPAASLFEFTPPKGASVKQQQAPEKSSDASAKHADDPTPTVIGSGWDAIVELPAGTAASSLTSNPLYSELTSSVIGGRVLSTSIVSVFIADDGRVFAGSVPVSALQVAAE
jgi:outer membrane lipoprotein-sorting protein